jgi:hypothetical protein
MVMHVIKGRTCKIAIDIPAYWDANTKSVLMQLMHYCLDEDKRKDVISSLNNLAEMENKLIESLKKIKEHAPEFEEKAREFIGMNLNHGFKLGSNYSMTDLARLEMMEQIKEYENLVGRLPTKKISWALIFYGFYLGRLAYETGFMLGTFISEDRVEEYKEEIERDMSYVG